nr:PREDICTED: calcium-activated chloride channel regulator family member 3-like [Latimeria chalumnae]|eukprot:XP_014351299.1 PREDICTED: calcium-activated chloride channel regulator family member 3-like [Latimeria chalumnae]
MQISCCRCSSQDEEHLSLSFVFVIFLHHATELQCTKLELVNNGYDGVVIVISPRVPENPSLIDKIKEMVTDASSYLFRATRNRAFYRDVKILLPKKWTPNPDLYKKPEGETFATAHVRIDIPSPMDYLKDNPYTWIKVQFGTQGYFIHFTPDYLLKEEIGALYGPRGKQVHPTVETQD